MDALLPWLPWIVGILLALAVLRFVVGLALRLLGIAALVLVAFLVWRALTGG
ncbi:hypothetical protein [Deinococcus pimensis]|uniref:hypothetical protein n=1 Tax=Deinococcus pimensis TaxID=309888 RepID=UPI0012FC8604|nr:hypothetical protein [Deinococcus pimensis]